MTTKLAVVPARGGSTRLKNKNIYPLGGKPLVLWTVESVIESGCFDKIIVSTDSEEIWDAVKHMPVERHQRPEEHATVRATALRAMINLMENSKQKYDIFAYFLPTCPFVDASDIKKGMDMLTEDVDSVVSVTEITECIQKACLIKNDWLMPVFDNLEFGMTNSKFVKKYLKPSGAFYISRWDNILEKENFYKGNVKGAILPIERSVDINTMQDMHYAEQILRDLE
jgi:CMP-N-acetylneuraminic acid synthetase